MRIMTAVGNGRVRFSNYMSTAKIFGVPVNMIMTTQFTGSMGSSNPTSSWFWIISLQDMDQTTVSLAFVDLTMTYYCKLWNRIIPGES